VPVAGPGAETPAQHPARAVRLGDDGAFAVGFGIDVADRGSGGDVSLRAAGRLAVAAAVHRAIDATPALGVVEHEAVAVGLRAIGVAGLRRTTGQRVIQFARAQSGLAAVVQQGAVV